jgi:hypothetical protein
MNFTFTVIVLLISLVFNNGSRAWLGQDEAGSSENATFENGDGYTERLAESLSLRHCTCDENENQNGATDDVKVLNFDNDNAERLSFGHCICDDNAESDDNAERLSIRHCICDDNAERLSLGHCIWIAEGLSVRHCTTSEVFDKHCCEFGYYCTERLSSVVRHCITGEVLDKHCCEFGYYCTERLSPVGHCEFSFWSTVRLLFRVIARSFQSTMAQAQNYKIPPKLGPDTNYETWKNEIEMWRLVTDLDKRKQALAVALSLTGKAREVALEIDADELNRNDGLTRLLNSLDKVFEKEAKDLSYAAYTEFDKFRMTSDMSMEDYIIEFERLYNKCRKHRMILPDAILAFKLF